MSEALAKKKTSAVANRGNDLPDFLKAGDARGRENITSNDIQLPRLALAQQMSPQLIEGDPKYIAGLKSGDAFNDLTGEIYGRGPFDLTVIQANKPRWIEFIPREDGGGIRDMNVPANDPRTLWDGQNPPIATLFYDYVVLLIPARDLIALSLKSSGIKTARRLNTLIAMREVPSFAGRYTLETVSEKNAKGTYFVYKIANSSVSDEDATRPGLVSEDLFNYASRLYDSFAGKNLVIEREPGSDDASFSTDEM